MRLRSHYCLAVLNLININGGVSGPGKVERTADGKHGELNAQMDGWSYGRFDVPTALIKSPEEKYRACAAKQEKVDALLKSILQFGPVNEHVQVVLFVGANQALPAKTGFKLPVTDDEMNARGFEGFFCIVGDHTQRAMNQLHSMFNRNPSWASLNATVFVCQRTLEVYAALKTLGILANIRRGKRVTLSFQDKISALREDYLGLAEHASVPGHKKRALALKKQRQQDFGGISAEQMKHLWHLATRKGEVWELLWKIIVGDVVLPDQRSRWGRCGFVSKAHGPVKSAANLTNTWEVDDSVLVLLLQDVVNGRSSLQGLNEQCALVKARKKVQTAILSDTTVDELDWDAAQKKFPSACQEDFVEQWVGVVSREGVKARPRTDMPELFLQELARRVESDAAVAASTPAQVCININAFRLKRAVKA